ncbi:hypothetical protein TNCT_115251 [Trichonephila clavata]|uniref:Uncharacterized protein n=1 Tax=Trichonephila clavata TaxID=2740835 RepID=A0A8X6J2D3_TRICU|nr:hypothetical protein TNCT_115251 [Trichonephila clavata]
MGEKKLSRPSVRLASLEEFQDEVARVKRPESFPPSPPPSTFPSWGFLCPRCFTRFESPSVRPRVSDELLGQ